MGPYIPPKELYNNGQDWETQTNLTEFAVNILKWYYWNQFWGEAEKKIYWQFSVSKTNWNYLSACAFVKVLNFKLNCDVRSGMNNNKCFTNGRIMYKTIVSEIYTTFFSTADL